MLSRGISVLFGKISHGGISRTDEVIVVFRYIITISIEYLRCDLRCRYLLGDEIHRLVYSCKLSGEHAVVIIQYTTLCNSSVQADSILSAGYDY